MSGSSEDDDRFVVALARGLGVLRAFKRGDTGLSNQELAERTGLARSTISRLTYTLARLGYLEYSQNTGRYSLSVAALALGFTALGGLAIRDVARPLMQPVADRFGCLVALGAPDRRTMVYIECCKGHSPLHLGLEIGSHVRMSTSAMAGPIWPGWILRRARRSWTRSARPMSAARRCGRAYPGPSRSCARRATSPRSASGRTR
jgi:DNA-binding IclR family transcriptional regulator